MTKLKDKKNPTLVKDTILQVTNGSDDEGIVTETLKNKPGLMENEKCNRIKRNLTDKVNQMDSDLINFIRTQEVITHVLNSLNINSIFLSESEKLNKIESTSKEIFKALINFTAEMNNGDSIDVLNNTRTDLIELLKNNKPLE